MTVIADTHVHLYPCYEHSRVLDSLNKHLGGLDPNATRVACLTEGKGLREFDALCGKVGAWTVEPSPETNCIVARHGAGHRIYMACGRQIVTRERIEILALVTANTIADGQTAADTIRSVLDSGGVPVVSWAPGKWFLERGKVVASLITMFSRDQLVLGDTSLRATCWPEPWLMRRARRQGMQVLAGSDPLPFPGEETRSGSYASLLEGDFNADRPATSLRAMLFSGVAQTVGRRSGPVDMLQRLRKNAAAKPRQ